LAEIDVAAGNPRAAIERVETGIRIATPEIGEKHAWVGAARFLLADAYAAAGDPHRAQEERAQADLIMATQPDGHLLRLWAAQGK
jgi:hypothetical protein